MNNIEMEILSKKPIDIEVDRKSGGTGNYNDLENKPSINNVELVGNLTTEDLNLDLCYPVFNEHTLTFGGDIGEYLSEIDELIGGDE